MDDAVRVTLRRNLDRERICPPLIVRPLPNLPDGYQRLAVLRELGWPTAPCFCWPCDDARGPPDLTKSRTFTLTFKLAL